MNPIMKELFCFVPVAGNVVLLFFPLSKLGMRLFLVTNLAGYDGVIGNLALSFT